MARVWIGGQENLLKGDVITAWSHTETEGITLQVQRMDTDTAIAIGKRIREISRGDGGYYDHQFTAEQLSRLLSDFGVEEEN